MSDKIMSDAIMGKWFNQDSEKELAEDEVHIWVNYLNIHQAKLKHLYPLLSDAEKERSEQFKFFKHRKHFIASHGFLHSVLAYYLDIAAEEILFSQGENGKPFISTEQNPQNIQFNMSHSGNIAILAVCRQHSVGIDIEFMERKTDWQGVIKRYFTENEQRKIHALPEELQKDAFYRVWTRKEAHMKVTGEGLRLSPSKFEVSVPPEPPSLITAADILTKTVDTDKPLAHYQMQEIMLPSMYKDYHACLSANFAFNTITHYIQS